MISRLADGYKRWRHTRGYGVHSPFAYNLLKYGLHPGHGYGYYGDHDIDLAVEKVAAGDDAWAYSPKRMRRDSKTLLRLLVASTPRSLWIDPRLPKPLFTAAEAAGYRTGERLAADWRKASMALIKGSEDSTLFGAELARWIAVPGHSLILYDAPPEAVGALFRAMPEGLMLRSRKTAFLTHRKGMSKLCYTMKL